MRRTKPPAAYAWAVVHTTVGVAAAALSASLAERWFDAQSLALFFVLPIITIAILDGLTASLCASVLSAIAINFLFVEPRHTLVVARAQDVAQIALFAIVAVLASVVAARARESARQAERRAAEATLLQGLSTQLADAQSFDAVAAAAAAALGRLSGGRGLTIAADERHWGEGFGETPRLAARWAMGTKAMFTPSVDGAVETNWRFWPVIVGRQSVLALGADGALSAEISAAGAQIAVLVGLALERVAAAERAERARIDFDRERLKSELLAGVSHDLRTPLATILFTLQSLQKFAADHSPETHDELLALAEGETKKLSKMVEDLLDTSRIGAEGAPVRIGRWTLEDVLALALDALGPDGAKAEISVKVDGDLPPITADRELAARALANVFSNAIKHGGGTIDIAAHRVGSAVQVEVRDHGPGLGASPEQLFSPFVRGVSGDGRSPGLGLGLSLARKFLEAQSATITAEDAPQGGALFRIKFPIASLVTEHVS